MGSNKINNVLIISGSILLVGVWLLINPDGQLILLCGGKAINRFQINLLILV